jgi:addiction module HigA family antidote
MFAEGKRVNSLIGIERPARLKLDRLDAASVLRDLAALPGNRLESLAGDRAGQYSIRINDRWRVYFEWLDGSPGPSNVEIVDYHQEDTTVAIIAIHPGEHLAEELKELGMSAAELGRKLDVPTNRITAILNGQRSVTGDTALRLAHFFGTTAEFWLNLQTIYDLRKAQEKLGSSWPGLVAENRAVCGMKVMRGMKKLLAGRGGRGGLDGSFHFLHVTFLVTFLVEVVAGAVVFCALGAFGAAKMATAESKVMLISFFIFVSPRLWRIVVLPAHNPTLPGIALPRHHVDG